MKYAILFLILLQSDIVLARSPDYLIVENSVAATGSPVDSMSGIVPSGKTAYLRWYGCTMDSDTVGLTQIQWGDDSGGWTTIMGCRDNHYPVHRTYMGDGVKRFRLRRINNGPTAKVIMAWADILIK